MKKAKYREINLYSYYDFSGMARHLEEMARQGWQLENIGSQFWTYRRCPPTEMRYAVVYFEKASDLDTAPLQEQQDFWEMCRTAGWELAASRGVMQIFRNPDPHAVPIETDPVVQVENVHAAMKKTLVPSYAVLLGCCLLQIWLTVRRAASDPIDLLTDPFRLPSFLLWGILGIHIAADLISYFRWLRKARTTAREEGTLLPPKSQRWRQMVLLAFGFLYILFLIFSALGICGYTDIPLPILLIALVYGAVLTIGIRGIQYLLKRRGVSPVTNRVLSGVIGCGACFLVLFAGVKWIAGGTPAMQGHVNTETRTSPAYPAGDTEHTYTVYHDPLPLTVEDLVGETAYTDYSCRRDVEGTPLMTQYDYRQEVPFVFTVSPEDGPELDYTVYQIKLDCLYEPLKSSFFKDKVYTIHGQIDFVIPHGWEAADAAPWGALDAYQRHDESGTPTGSYLLCYENRFVEIRFDGWDNAAPTAEQMALVRDILGFGALT